MSLPPFPADGERNWAPQLRNWGDALEVAVEGHVDEVLEQWAPDVLAAGTAATTARDQTIALRDEVQVISGLTGEDAAVATLIGDGGSQTREAITQATVSNVRTYPSMAALMATDAPTNSRVAIAGHTSFDDVTNVMFQIQATQPADRVLHRSSVPLDDGRWASPRDYQMMSQVAWDSRGAAEMIATAETYVAAGADLVYDTTRPGPLWTTDIVHEAQTAPYPITCSGFAGLVVGGYNYEDTTYVADANTQTWRWGNTYPTAQFTGHPFGTNRFLKYFWQAGLAYYYSSGKTKLMPGDLLFYCKQDPEGPGTGGLYFLNNYHVAVYKGDGQVIHAYAPSSGNGVVQQALSSTPVDDICWIVRAPVKHVPLNKSPGPVATTAVFTGDVWTWVDDDLLQVDLNGISVASPLTAGSHTIMEDVGYTLTRTVRRTALAVSGTTSIPVRILLTAAGVMQVYSPAAIPAGTVFHGGLSGHVTG